MSNGKPTVFVVDDDLSVRESLRLLIESAGWRAETFDSGEEFLSGHRPASTSCLVLDIHLPDLGGFDLQTLLADRTELPIIFISGYGNVPMTVRAMRAGAVEFLTKPFANDAMLQAIQNALDRSSAQLASAARMRALRNSYASLSHREQEVMALIVDGRLNKEVGGELGISEITVKAHRGNLMRKMEAGSLPELVKMAVRLCVTTL